MYAFTFTVMAGILTIAGTVMSFRDGTATALKELSYEVRADSEQRKVEFDRLSSLTKEVCENDASQKGHRIVARHFQKLSNAELADEIAGTLSEFRQVSNAAETTDDEAILMAKMQDL